MKLFLIVCLSLLFSARVLAGDGLWVNKSWQDVSDCDGVSYGIASYSDQDHDLACAIYGHFSMIGYGDLIRINTGFVFPPYYLKGENVVRITMEGGISTIFRSLIYDLDIEVGLYYGFSASKNPYGLMIGILY